MTAAEDNRAAFVAALTRLEAAHDALAAEVTGATLARYHAACAECHVAFEAMALERLERAKARGLR